MPATFVPGIQLSAAFYTEVVRPLLTAALPRLRYSAALLGPGSDVLGYDTARSTDHDWGPRLQLFLPPDGYARVAVALDSLLERELPSTFAGFPTRFPRPADDVWAVDPAAGPVRHRVVLSTPIAWYAHWLGFQPQQPIGVPDWLATPTQLLLEQTAGAVYHDGLATLATARAALAWYPDDVWRYVLAAQWRRIAQEEAFVGRGTELGDEPGTAVLSARLVRDLIRLSLLQSRRYPPYSKWLGTALGSVEYAGPIALALSSSGTQRQEALCLGYEAAARAHNALGLTEPVEPTVRQFHDRPYRVLMADRFADALRDSITDPWLATLPLIGAIDQFADSTDLLGDRDRRRAVTVAALGLPATVGDKQV